jgi:uncharacterized cupredoxin-like copper-binding protein
MYDMHVVDKRRRWVALMTLALAALLIGAGCTASGPQQPPGSILIELKDSPWQVEVANTTLTAGSTTFYVKNVGSTAHDLTIIKTDLPPDKLPQDAGKAKEDGRVGGTPTLSPGQAMPLTVTLQPGNYVFICNEPGHYALGMHTHVTVQ